MLRPVHSSTRVASGMFEKYKVRFKLQWLYVNMSAVACSRPNIPYLSERPPTAVLELR